MTASSDDEKIAKLMDAGGMEGAAMYGWYWRINEIIASQMEGKEPACSVTYSVSRWSRLLVTRPSLLFSTLSRMAVTGVVTVERRGDDITVTNCNLLKYRDEYARKSGQAPDNIPARTDIDGEAEADTEQKKKKTIAPSSNEHDAKAPPIGTLPCIGERKSWPLHQAKVNEWQETYPGIDVKAELREARQWLIDNPTKRKTYAGMTRYLNSWLAKEQDKPKGGSNGKAGSNHQGAAVGRVQRTDSAWDKAIEQRLAGASGHDVEADVGSIPASGIRHGDYGGLPVDIRGSSPGVRGQEPRGGPAAVPEQD